MIDMHTHILFNVDDGPKTEEESIQMLKQSVNEGITEIISTSHALHPYYDVSYSTVETHLEHLRRLIVQNEIPLTLHSGHEIRLSDKVGNLLNQKEIHVLANSNYVLIELPSNMVPAYTKDMIITLKSLGYTPIIAHPERNSAIAEQPKRLERLIREGAFAQITAGSLSGHFGKTVQKLSLELVRANYVHTYGSDVHNLTTRPFLFLKGLYYLEKKKELDAVDIFLENNNKIVKNEQMIMPELGDITDRKWWKMFR